MSRGPRLLQPPERARSASAHAIIAARAAACGALAIGAGLFVWLIEWQLYRLLNDHFAAVMLLLIVAVIGIAAAGPVRPSHRD